MFLSLLYFDFESEFLSLLEPMIFIAFVLLHPMILFDTNTQVLLSQHVTQVVNSTTKYSYMPCRNKEATLTIFLRTKILACIILDFDRFNISHDL